MRAVLDFLFLFYISLAAIPASAHEVYVLDSHEIGFAMAQKPLDLMVTIKENPNQFLLWTSFGLLIVSAVFIFSVSSKIEEIFDKYLIKIKRAAPIIAQVTLGLSLLASAYYGAIFGVEIPFDKAFGNWAGILEIAVSLIGAALALGVFPRLAALGALFIFIPLLFKYGIYMLNYFTYLGEALTIFLLGSNYDFFRKKNTHPWWHVNLWLSPKLQKYKYFIIRIFFGASLIYAALYAKYIHGALALETVAKYHLTQYFHFDPLFLVLGAFLIEIFLGICFAIGFEIRFASIFFLVFLTMSVIFFREAVWPHVILIGTALSMFTHGYDKYTLTGRLSKRKDLEPVL